MEEDVALGHHPTFVIEMGVRDRDQPHDPTLLGRPAPVEITHRRRALRPFPGPRGKLALPSSDSTVSVFGVSGKTGALRRFNCGGGW